MRLTFTFLFIVVLTTLSWSQCEDFEMTLIPHHPTCPGFSDGRVEISTSGGTGDIITSIMDTLGNEFTGLPGGTENILDDGCYYITVTDELGCELSDTICLIDPVSITAEINVTDPTYPGACDGIVAATSVEGYQGPFDLIYYHWTIPDAPNASEISDVCAGEYTITIMDAIGCTGIYDFALGSLAEITANPLNEIEVYTNRTTGELHVKNPTNAEFSLQLMNLAGQIVFKSDIQTSKSIFTPQLNKGVYLYSIITKSGIQTTGKLFF